MLIRLFTNHNTLIHQQTLRQHAVAPEIVVWKGRYFKQAFTQGNESWIRYTEVSICILEEYDPE